MVHCMGSNEHDENLIPFASSVSLKLKRTRPTNRSKATQGTKTGPSPITGCAYRKQVSSAPQRSSGNAEMLEDVGRCWKSPKSPYPKWFKMYLTHNESAIMLHSSSSKFFCGFSAGATRHMFLPCAIGALVTWDWRNIDRGINQGFWIMNPHVQACLAQKQSKSTIVYLLWSSYVFLHNLQKQTCQNRVCVLRA